MEKGPDVFTNREFQDLTQEEVDRLTDAEAHEMEGNPALRQAMRDVEAGYGHGGEWREHWVTLDNKGTRIYARVYFTEHHSVSINAEGEVVRVESF